MTNSVSSIRISNDTIPKSYVINRGARISAADIFLNGHKIRVSGSFKDIARQINRFKAGTGVAAETNITKNGQEKLVLRTTKSKISIVDKSGVFSTYFNANKMGIGADKLIEIAGIKTKSAPELVYSRYENKQKVASLSSRLSGDNISYLGTLDKLLQIPQIMEIDQGEVPDLLIEAEGEVNNGPTQEELQLIRDAKIREQLLKALAETAEEIALSAVFKLGMKSKRITNEQSVLIASIQNKLIESDLGETYLRRESEKLSQEIADAIYAQKSFTLYSTYSLTQEKIDLAIDSAISATKLNEFNSLASDIIDGFKIAKFTVSSSNAKRISGAITTGLSEAKNITLTENA